MADPFEVRMRFTSQLQHLNASTTSSQKAAHYALKYRDMDEDLHSCILEQLERNSMNNRANIMYFIEHLCTTAQKESHLTFVRMMQRDILRVVDAVAPSDGSGAANVKVVRSVLGSLMTKGILGTETVKEIEAGLEERDTSSAAALIVGPTPAAGGAGGENDTPMSGGGGQGSSSLLNGGGVREDGKAKNGEGGAGGGGGGGAGGAPIPTTRLDKRQIEQRIEEDRERHKRLRESIWAVGGDSGGGGSKGDDDEFERLWDEASEIGDDDYLAAEEDAVERRVAVEVE